ncbi:MAG TPA: response regulator [Bacteroidota bacterium]|jgi:DNA-binding response OmpR family regulator
MNKAKTILFIEDEEELLNTIGNLLRDIGYEVMAVLDAEDGLMKIEETTPDLILADIKLPGIDGFAFFKQVKQDKRFAAVPFVFLTAYNDLKAMRFAKENGASEYITKPFDFEYLIARIKDLLPPP